MQLVAVSSFLTPATEAVYPQRIWLFCVGPGPFLLLVLRLSVYGRNANLAGGFAGRRLWVLVVFAWLFPLFVDYCTYTATVLCTFLAFNFYFCQDRASGNIGRTRGKKKEYSDFSCQKILSEAH